jgi:hypothetical protein
MAHIFIYQVDAWVYMPAILGPVYVCVCMLHNGK